MSFKDILFSHLIIIVLLYSINIVYCITKRLYGYEICFFKKIIKPIHNMMNSKRYDKPPLLMILLGSGGHTKEMLLLIQDMKLDNFRVNFVYTNCDQLSPIQASQFINLKGFQKSADKFSFTSIERINRVKEKFIQSLKRLPVTLFESVKLIINSKPDIIISNGPGMGALIMYLAFLCELLLFWECKLVYIEGFSCLNKLSRTGSLVLPITDKFYVYWESLKERSSKAQYLGFIY